MNPTSSWKATEAQISDNSQVSTIRDEFLHLAVRTKKDACLEACSVQHSPKWSAMVVMSMHRLPSRNREAVVLSLSLDDQQPPWCAVMLQEEGRLALVVDGQIAWERGNSLRDSRVHVITLIGSEFGGGCKLFVDGAVKVEMGEQVQNAQLKDGRLLLGTQCVGATLDFYEAHFWTYMLDSKRLLGLYTQLYSKYTINEAAYQLTATQSTFKTPRTQKPQYPALALKTSARSKKTKKRGVQMAQIPRPPQLARQLPALQLPARGGKGGHGPHSHRKLLPKQPAQQRGCLTDRRMPQPRQRKRSDRTNGASTERAMIVTPREPERWRVFPGSLLAAEVAHEKTMDQFFLIFRPLLLRLGKLVQTGPKVEVQALISTLEHSCREHTGNSAAGLCELRTNETMKAAALMLVRGVKKQPAGQRVVLLPWVSGPLDPQLVQMVCSKWPHLHHVHAAEGATVSSILDKLSEHPSWLLTGMPTTVDQALDLQADLVPAATCVCTVACDWLTASLGRTSDLAAATDEHFQQVSAVEKKAAEMRREAQEFMEEMDVNKRGMLNLEEFIAGGGTQEQFGQFDTNEDQMLDEEEIYNFIRALSDLETVDDNIHSCETDDDELEELELEMATKIQKLIRGRTVRRRLENAETAAATEEAAAAKAAAAAELVREAAIAKAAADEAAAKAAAQKEAEDEAAAQGAEAEAGADAEAEAERERQFRREIHGNSRGSEGDFGIAELVEVFADVHHHIEENSAAASLKALESNLGTEPILTKSRSMRK